MANKEGVPYVTLNNEIKKKARLMHEAGESLISIAKLLRITYGTLRNVAAKENWVKGKKKVLFESRSMFKAIADSERDLKKIKESYSHELDRIMEIIKKTEPNEETGRLVKSHEEAAKNRIQSLKEAYDFAIQLKDLDELKSLRYELEKIKLEAEIAEYESKINNLEGGAGDIELK